MVHACMVRNDTVFVFYKLHGEIVLAGVGGIYPSFFVLRTRIDECFLEINKISKTLKVCV